MSYHKTYRQQKIVDVLGAACFCRVTFTAGGSQLSKSLVGEINEYFLFHGTKQNQLKSIEDHGLDSRLSANAMFGNGVYFAESSTKADQYTGDARLLPSLPFSVADYVSQQRTMGIFFIGHVFHKSSGVTLSHSWCNSYNGVVLHLKCCIVC